MLTEVRHLILKVTRPEDQNAWYAAARLLRIAQRDTGQAGRVANFLLAWHNAAENGGWNPTELWNVDDAIADDMLSVLRLIRDSSHYPADLGFEEEITAVWRAWRSPTPTTPKELEPS
jgi:hypothetical protein